MLQDHWWVCANFDGSGLKTRAVRKPQATLGKGHTTSMIQGGRPLCYNAPSGRPLSSGTTHKPTRVDTINAKPIAHSQ